MNGVKVKIIISLEVKTVNMETAINSVIKIEYWLFFARLVTLIAKYLKKPNSSKNTDKKSHGKK